MDLSATPTDEPAHQFDDFSDTLAELGRASDFEPNLRTAFDSAHVSNAPEPERFAHVGKPTKAEDFAHVGKIEQPPAFSTLWGAGANPVWRPKKFVRDDSYPRVTATGFYFRKDSGGFSLIRRSDRKCVGFYTKLSIQKLEEQHGSKNSKNKRSARRS